MWRVVGNDHRDEPVWFGWSGEGRFDLHPADGHGTCYVGFDPQAALLEAGFRDAAVDAGRLTFTPAMFASRHLQQLQLPSDLQVADLEDPEIVGFGVTRELTTITPYKLSQWWAQAIHHTGPDKVSGVRFEPRHAPNRYAAAIFGPRGVGNWKSTRHESVNAATLRRLSSGTGVQILEPPTSAEGLTIIE